VAAAQWPGGVARATSGGAWPLAAGGGSIEISAKKLATDRPT